MLLKASTISFTTSNTRCLADLGIVVALITSKIPVNFIKKFTPAFFGFTFGIDVNCPYSRYRTKTDGRQTLDRCRSDGYPAYGALKISLILYLAKWLEVPRDLKQFLALLGLL